MIIYLIIYNIHFMLVCCELIECIVIGDGLFLLLEPIVQNDKIVLVINE
jgi:hypothetical protein